MKPLPLILSLLCLPAFAEPRTVTLLVNGNGTKGPLRSEDVLEVPAHHSATAIAFSNNNFLSFEKDGIKWAGSIYADFSIAGPCRLRWASTGDLNTSEFITFRLTPETFDANKTLVLGPTTNTVIVSYQSSSNLVDWTTVTNQVFQGAPSAQFFRVTASPTVTP